MRNLVIAALLLYAPQAGAQVRPDGWACGVPASYSATASAGAPQGVQQVTFTGGTGAGFAAIVTIVAGPPQVASTTMGGGYTVGDVLTGGGVTLTLATVEDRYYGDRKKQTADPCPNAPKPSNPRQQQ